LHSRACAALYDFAAVRILAVCNTLSLRTHVSQLFESLHHWLVRGFFYVRRESKRLPNVEF